MHPLLEAPAECPVCSSERLKPLRILENRKHRQVDLDHLLMMGCKQCGVVYTYPLPPHDELEEHYASDGWDKLAGRSPESLARRGEQKRGRIEEAYEALRALLPDTGAGGGPPRALDFGCGTGEWLDVLLSRGWDTTGIEPAPSARAVTADRHRMLEELPTTPSFDLVVLNHVLEHLRDPLAVLSSVAEATHPGGLLYISVPDLGRLPVHEDVNYVANSVHIFSFTRAGLSSLLGLAGFTAVDLSSSELGRDNDRTLKSLARRSEKRAPPNCEPLREALDSLIRFDRDESEAAVEADVPPRPGGGLRARLGVGRKPERTS